MHIAGGDRLVVATVELERIGRQQQGAAGKPGVTLGDECVGALVIIESLPGDVGRSWGRGG